MFAKFLRRDFVAPLLECAFGEFLNIALVNQCDSLAFVVDGVLNRSANQALAAEGADRLNTQTSILEEFRAQFFAQETRQFLVFL